MGFNGKHLSLEGRKIIEENIKQRIKKIWNSKRTQ